MDRVQNLNRLHMMRIMRRGVRNSLRDSTIGHLPKSKKRPTFNKSYERLKRARRIVSGRRKIYRSSSPLTLMGMKVAVEIHRVAPVENVVATIIILIIETITRPAPVMIVVLHLIRSRLPGRRVLLLLHLKLSSSSW